MNHDSEMLDKSLVIGRTPASDIDRCIAGDDTPFLYHDNTTYLRSRSS